MPRKTETRPSRQANGRATQKSNDSVTHEAVFTLIVAALFLFVIFGVPNIMYDFIAPLKGWC